MCEHYILHWMQERILRVEQRDLHFLRGSDTVLRSVRQQHPLYPLPAGLLRCQRYYMRSLQHTRLPQLLRPHYLCSVQVGLLPHWLYLRSLSFSALHQLSQLHCLPELRVRLLPQQLHQQLHLHFRVGSNWCMCERGWVFYCYSGRRIFLLHLLQRGRSLVDIGHDLRVQSRLQIYWH